MSIQQELSFDSLTPAGQRILEGSHTPAPGTDHYSQLLQKQLKRKTTKLIPTGISTQDIITGWKKAKEQTTAEPSNMSFGQCKALAQDTYLATMEASLMSIAMKSRIAFESWKRGVDAVIPKKTSSPRVDRLRTIVLHATEANFCYKHLAKKIVDAAEKIPGALAPEQYAKKGRRCGSQVLSKRLTFNVWRQRRMPGIITHNDLHSNYERTCHSIAALAACRLGIQESEVTFMTSTLQDMKHKIHTAFGAPTTHTEEMPGQCHYHHKEFIKLADHQFHLTGYYEANWILICGRPRLLHNPQRQRSPQWKKS
jgi:hypothetical protein